MLSTRQSGWWPRKWLSDSIHPPQGHHPVVVDGVDAVARRTHPEGEAVLRPAAPVVVTPRPRHDPVLEGVDALDGTLHVAPVPGHRTVVGAEIGTAVAPLGGRVPARFDAADGPDRDRRGAHDTRTPARTRSPPNAISSVSHRDRHLDATRGVGVGGFLGIVGRVGEVDPPPDHQIAAEPEQHLPNRSPSGSSSVCARRGW